MLEKNYNVIQILERQSARYKVAHQNVGGGLKTSDFSIKPIGPKLKEESKELNQHLY